jgi:hypothetical protein
VITASSVNLLWWLQNFFNLKFWIRAGISRRDLTLADEIALLEQIKHKPPNNTHHQLVEVTGVAKLTIVQVIQQQDKLPDERTLHQRGQGSYQEQKCESQVIMITEEHVVGFLDGNAGFV